MANYRQLSGTSLGNSASCPSCYTALYLCYSAVSAADLCCNASTGVTVYVPAGQTFNSGTSSDATTLYSNTALTQVAATGWYSDDTANCGTP